MQTMKEMKETHLGNGVYASFDPDALELKLYTDTDIRADRQPLTIGPREMNELMSFMREECDFPKRDENL